MHPATTYEQSIFTLGDEKRIDVSTTIHHWQLRDLICAGEGEDEFFYVAERQVLRYNTRSEEAVVVQNLSYNPTCITFNHGYIVAGGARSELEVRHLPTNTLIFKGNLGGSVNNSVHVCAEPPGGQNLRLFVSNNDETVKVFSLPSMNPITSIRCHVAINFTARQPHGRLLGCAGDSSSTLIYETTPTGYRLFSTYTQANDVGMSCAWNSCGTLLASAHQDGTLVVWDPRGQKVVAKYQVPQACRCVKFSPGPLDLLAFTEQDNVAHLVDTRRWDRMQTLSNPQQGGQGHNSPVGIRGWVDGVAGVAFTPSGSWLYKGLESHVGAYSLDAINRLGLAVGSLR